MSSTSTESDHGPLIEATVHEFERTLDKLESARAFAKPVHQQRLFSLTRKLLPSDAGLTALYRFAPRFDTAGVFQGGDWDEPQRLDPGLVRATLDGGGMYPPLECLSELRLLAIACGEASHPTMSGDAARAFLEDVLARNLDLPFPQATEASRQDRAKMRGLQRLYLFILERIGTDGILAALVGECERVLLQRPIMVQRVEQMLRSAARIVPDTPVPGQEAVWQHARWMMEALEGPTPAAREHGNAAAYRLALADMDKEALSREADAFGSRMDGTGLVSPSHAALLRHIVETDTTLLPAALALNPIGRTSLAEYEQLICQIIRYAVFPQTARCIYGLSRLLNRGILFFPPVPPGLQHVMVEAVAPEVAEQLRAAVQLPDAPSANAQLLAGTLSVIGQPRGVDQGHNPTCQAARAISLWSQNDVGYLLDLICRAALENNVVMHFEGGAIRSNELPPGLAEELHTELDPVSLVLTPHLDKIYMEMGRRTIGRPEDGHRWVNPEFHGWWVYRGFASLIDLPTEGIRDFDDFVRRFYAAYHPEYNGGRELVYAQPCGVVSTTAAGEFIGWHAISIERVARDPSGEWRVYFFNPNRDKGQNWGQNIVTSTCDNGEWEGESSLSFEQFLMRLYLFHFRRSELGDTERVPSATVAEIRRAVAESWGAGRTWLDGPQS